MNSNAAVKYFKQYRIEHNMDESDYVTNGEVLLWLAQKIDAEAYANSFEAQDARHKKSLELLDKYMRETPPEEIKALIDSLDWARDEDENKTGYAAEALDLHKVKTGVHRTHCCKRHGCKYNESDCPVTSGEVIQDHSCEYCVFEGPIETWEDIFDRFEASRSPHNQSIHDFKNWLSENYIEPKNIHDEKI